jgi:diguanylate cyclase (GGDEF)-like protein
MPLETQKIAAINFDVCHSCLGIWIPNPAIKGIVAARAMTSPQFLVQLLDRITKIEQGAYTDKLTLLRNRRFFDRQLYAEIARARGSHYLSLVLLDLDGFKPANDTYGHATGDLVLKDFGEILNQLIRKNDCAARVGGDEFGIILPETDPAGALAIAERIIAETAEHTFSTVDEKPIKNLISVSCGIAAYPADFAGVQTEEIEYLQMHLFNLADAALYSAKDQGKGQAVCAGALGDDDRSRHIVVKPKVAAE